MFKRYLAQVFVSLVLIIAMPTMANEDASTPQLAYFTLEPDLTTNFFTPEDKLGYIQVRIDVMVANQNDLPLIEKHQPLIRDAIIEILGEQTEETIKSLAGREALRHSLVKDLNAILLPETGKTLIADLLFTKYLYQ